MSKIEVNEIDKQNGSTLTIGGSGTTVQLGTGASQTGFGRTGTVDWQTTPKTGDFTAVNGEGYFVNTTSGTITMTLPSGTAGSIVAIQDYNKTFDDNNFTINPASGQKVNAGTASAGLTISTEGQGLTFVYVDSTVGWKTIIDNAFNAGGSTFLVATGGTEVTSGDFKIHTFTGPGTFCVSEGGSPAGNDKVEYLVVAGGGGGGGTNCQYDSAGGGGAGGYRESPGTTAGSYTVSPLGASPATAITVSAQAYAITVGGGGVGNPNNGCTGTNGNPSSFGSEITSTGGGGGGSAGGIAGAPGGSGGGGGGGGGPPGQPGGTGNTPPVNPPQGQNGGLGGGNPNFYGAGGGGALAAGVGPGGPASPAVDGGGGATSSINNTPTARAGGGGGGSSPGRSPAGGGSGGSGGGANGGNNNGTTNTGGGGGGGSNGQGGTGGSGIVILRYKFQ